MIQIVGTIPDGDAGATVKHCRAFAEMLKEANVPVFAVEGRYNDEQVAGVERVVRPKGQEPPDPQLVFDEVKEELGL